VLTTRTRGVLEVKYRQRCRDGCAVLDGQRRSLCGAAAGGVGEYDLSAPWQAAADSAAVPLVDCVMMAGLVAAGTVGRLDLGRWIIAAAGLAGAAAFAISAAGYRAAAGGGADQQWSLWALAAGRLAIALVAAVRERCLLGVLLAHGLLVVAADVAEVRLVGRLTADDVLACPPLVGLLELALWTALAAVRAWGRRAAGLAIRRDQARRLSRLCVCARTAGVGLPAAFDAP
jgi:hypothetical protein